MANERERANARDRGRIPPLAFGWPRAAGIAAPCCCMPGCGRVIAQKATEQLIAGDAVDRTISQIDFRVLIGKKVYLDTQYVNKTVPGVGFVTSEYIISSLRQKMMCDGLLLEEKADEADFIVEMRNRRLGSRRPRDHLRNAGEQLFEYRGLRRPDGAGSRRNGTEHARDFLCQKERSDGRRQDCPVRIQPANARADLAVRAQPVPIDCR